MVFGSPANAYIYFIMHLLTDPANRSRIEEGAHHIPGRAYTYTAVGIGLPWFILLATGAAPEAPALHAFVRAAQCAA